MNISRSIRNGIKKFPPGEIFSYQDLPEYTSAPNTVAKAIGRMVLKKQIKRLSKGKFYVSKLGVLGERKPSDTELVRSMLFKGDKLRGYVTGLSLYNKLGLTTQIPTVIYIAVNGSRQTKSFGTITIKTISTAIPIRGKDVLLLQYLDALKDIKKIPDTKPTDSLMMMSRYIKQLPEEKQKRIVFLAIQYYQPQVRSLLGLILEYTNQASIDSLKNSLNPITSYEIGLDKAIWPGLSAWNIKQ